MKCCNSKCRKEIKDKEPFIGSNYGEFCSERCWLEVAKDVVGYDIYTRDVKAEKIAELENKKRFAERKIIPKWGDEI